MVGRSKGRREGGREGGRGEAREGVEGIVCVDFRAPYFSLLEMGSYADDRLHFE